MRNETFNIYAEDIFPIAENLTAAEILEVIKEEADENLTITTCEFGDNFPVEVDIETLEEIVAEA